MRHSTYAFLMQGSVFQMLQASPEILKTVKVIQAEFSKYPFYEGTVVYDQYRDWLIEQGFSKCFVDDDLQGDAIFIRLPEGKAQRHKRKKS